MASSEESYVFSREAIRQYAGVEGPLGVMAVAGRDTLTEPHRHEFSELVVVTGGEGGYRHGDQEFTLCRGDLFVLPPGMLHWYREERSLKLINVLYLESELPLPWRELERVPGYLALFRMEPELRGEHRFGSHLRLREVELERGLALIGRIREELITGTNVLATLLLGELFVLLARCYAGREREPDRSAGLLQLERALRYLERHYAERLTRRQLARLAAMSESAFFRAFKRATGESVSAYLLAFRLDRAAELLRTTSLPLGEIASACGFSDPSYLSRQFSRRFNLPPNRYRLTFFSQ